MTDWQSDKGRMKRLRRDAFAPAPLYGGSRHLASPGREDHEGQHCCCLSRMQHQPASARPGSSNYRLALVARSSARSSTGGWLGTMVTTRSDMRIAEREVG